MENLFLINNDIVCYFLGKHKKKNEDKIVYYIGIKINNIEKVLCWLSEKEFNELSSNK